MDGTSKWSYQDWFGSCYGLAAFSCLAGAGELDPAKYLGGAETLYEADFTKNTASKVNYYFWQQHFPAVEEKQHAFMSLNQETQLDQLEALARRCDGGKGAPVLVYYQWKSHSTSDKLTHAHAVIASGQKDLETAVTCQIQFKSYSFNHVIFLYDNALGDTVAEAYRYHLYYNDDGVWGIPGKDIVSSSAALSKLNKYNNGQLVLVTADPTVINAIGLNGRVNIGRANSNVLYLQSGDNVNLTTAGGSASIQEGVVEAQTGGLDLHPVFTAGQAEGANTMSVVLLDSDSYTLTTQDPGLSFSLYAGDYFLTASADASGTVTFGPAGKVTLQSDSESYALSVTANNSPVSWDTVEIRGNRAANVTLQLTDSGVEITSDEAGTVTVIGITEETRNQQTFSLERGSALVTDQDGVPTLYKACLSGTDRGDGTVDITVDHPSASGKARLIAARYDDQGKMLACAAAEVTLTPNQPLHTVLDLTKGGTEYQETRLFLVDDTGLPLCPAGRVQK